ncbi:MAG: ribosome maturation factor RimM [Bacteroidota bacterium]
MSVNPMMPVDPEALLLMGRCGRAHGVKGEVKVFPETDDPQRFDLLDRVFVGKSVAKVQEATVESVRYQVGKGGRVTVLMKLDVVPTREDAVRVRQLNVYAHEDDLPAPRDGEVLIHQMIGLSVQDADTDEVYGTVRDVLEGAANLLLVVAREGQPDVLVPDVDPIVLDVDVEGGVITIQPPEGLIE